jgi:hypothetical protein
VSGELVCPPRWGTVRNLSRDTIGPEIGEVAVRLGYPLMPWQQYIADVTGELDDEGRLWYPETRLTVPRQSGKTQFTLTRQVDRMLHSVRRGWGRRPLGVYTAQTQAMAREKLVEEWHPIIETSELNPLLLPGNKGFIRSNGREQLRWEGGGRMITVPPTATGGHSLTVDVVDYDEAFAARDARVEQGLGPTQITRLSPQFNVTSTAGASAVDSPYLWDKVEDGRARVEFGAVDGRVAYFEWSAPDDADPSDPATWIACMPALGHTITAERIQIEHDKLPADEFARAYLNRWTGSVIRLIPAAAWASNRDAESQIIDRIWMSADASPGDGGRTAAISVGGYRADGRIGVEVLEHSAGLSWVAERIGQLTRKWSIDRLYVDPIGPIGSILPDIRVEANTNIEEVDAKTMIAACARFHQAVLEGTMRHRGQDVLDAAVDGVAKRQVLDSWAYARRLSSSDICPLVSVTLAHWGAAINPVRGLITMAT